MLIYIKEKCCCKKRKNTIIEQYICKHITGEEKKKILENFYSKYRPISYENLPYGGVLLKGIERDSK